MNPIQPSIPTYSHAVPSNTAQGLVPASLHAQYSHSQALSLARISVNAQLALEQIKDQSNNLHRFLALLTKHGIADTALHLQSTQGADAHYGRNVNIQGGGDAAHLTVRVRLNDQAQYDIAGVDLHMPESGRTESIHLSSRPPVSPDDQIP